MTVLNICSTISLCLALVVSSLGCKQPDGEPRCSEGAGPEYAIRHLAKRLRLYAAAHDSKYPYDVRGSDQALKAMYEDLYGQHRQLPGGDEWVRNRFDELRGYMPRQYGDVGYLYFNHLDVGSRTDDTVLLVEKRWPGLTRKSCAADMAGQPYMVLDASNPNDLLGQRASTLLKRGTLVQRVWDEVACTWEDAR